MDLDRMCRGGFSHASAMAGRMPTANGSNSGNGKATPEPSDSSIVSATPAQARVRLKRVDHCYKVIKTDYALKLKTGTFVAGPDHVCFNSANHRETNYNAITAVQLASIVHHETMGRNIADMQIEIAVLKMLDNDRKIDRVPGGAPHIGNTKICTR